MNEKDSGELSSSRKRKWTAPETGPYILRSLLEDVPLSGEGDRDDIEINCVEFLGTWKAIALTSRRLEAPQAP